MRSLVCSIVGCFLASSTMAAETDLPFPVNGQTVFQNLNLGVTQTDGSIDVVFATKPDPERLADFLSLMVVATAQQVRFSATFNAEDRIETLRSVEDFITSTGVPWHVCHGWWLSPDADYSETVVRDDLGGSLIFIDNGQSSDVVDNPAADMVAALTADPIFGGTFVGNAQRVDDTGKYFDAVSAIWGQVVPNRELDQDRQEKGGWVDGR